MTIKELIDYLSPIENKTRVVLISKRLDIPFAVTHIGEVESSPAPDGPIYIRASAR